MLYIFESEIFENKSLIYGLRSIFGIGQKQSSIICKKLGFSNTLKVKSLSKDQINQLIKYIEFMNLIISSDLRQKIILKKKSLISIKSYRGIRRSLGFPIRGQRTHTNAKTAKKRRS